MVTNALFSFLFFLSIATAAPPRIVTLTPALGEIVSEIMKSDQEIVGVTEYSDVPPSLKNKISVGPYFKVDIEKIVSLKPTHIFATDDGNDKAQIEKLKKLGFKVVLTRSSTLTDIEEAYKKTGSELGRTAEAENLAQSFSKKIELIKKTALQKKRKVVVQIGDSPLVVVGGRGFLSEVVSLTGVRNIFEDLQQAYPKISREEVLARKPDQIIFLSMSSSESEIEKILDSWRSLGFKSVKAIKGDRIVRPTKKILEGIDLLMQAENE